MLDGKGKTCYYNSMEHTTEINKNIAKNLMYYRKAAGLTQAGLAEKINYSDKSVSKWESGNGVPDVYTLLLLAELYGVTLNDLVGEGTPVLPTRERRGLRGWIMLLASGIVWLVATCFYVLVKLIRPESDWWLIFLYATLANSIVIVIFASVWKYRFVNFLAISSLIWVAILCVHFTLRGVLLSFGANARPLWLLYILGVPLQVLECMWGLFRSKLQRNKKKNEQKTAKDEPVSEQAE